jgi:hypothetical protein
MDRDELSAVCQSEVRTDHPQAIAAAEVKAADEGADELTRYLISFDDGAMTFPDEDLPDVAAAANAVAREAMDAGVWVFGGGLHSLDTVSVVSTDGAVTDGASPKAYIGGFSVIDVPSRDEALTWAAKIAVACRCDQEVREFVPGSTP